MKRTFFLIFVFLFSVCLRWYMLPQHLFFGFEQGRDAQIIADIFYKHDFKLVGPKTDLAGIFHGAYYYYLLLPAYVFSHGNPLAASFWLILISSLTTVVAFFFAKDIFRSGKAAVLTSLLVTSSYEYVIYARWLSNVTPAIPLILLTFWMVWKYHQEKKSLAFVLAFVAAAAAAQFEIVLVLLFGWVFLCFFLARILRWPGWKTFLLATVMSAFLFTPHLLFNLRNQNIMVRSVISFAMGTSPESTHGSVDLASNWRAFQTNYVTSFRRSLSLPNQPIVLSFVGLVFVLGIVYFLHKHKQKNARQKMYFFLIWLFMCLPVLLFHDVAGLTQLYLGVGMAIIFLFVLALQTLWQTRLEKILVALSLLIVLSSFSLSLQKLQHNDDVFFVTIQKDLNYADQQEALQFIHDDAQSQTYRFVAYTIPYLQPEGWQYLRHFLYPQDKTDDGAKLVYIVIEDQVDPFWIKKWNEDLGASQLLTEQQFGLIHVQKRILE